MTTTPLKARLSTLGTLALLAGGTLLLTQPTPAAAAPAAQAGPTEHAQCKQEGWRAFGDRFKNQGDCVSFVNALGDAGGDGGLPVDPAATPELGSLVLFGSGAASLAGYTLTRLRARRRG